MAPNSALSGRLTSSLPIISQSVIISHLSKLRTSYMSSGTKERERMQEWKGWQARASGYLPTREDGEARRGEDHLMLRNREVSWPKHIGFHPACTLGARSPAGIDMPSGTS